MEKAKVTIIPAAGKSARFHELGKSYPKCCLPYKNEPIICHILKTALEVSEYAVIMVANDDQLETINDTLDKFLHNDVDRSKVYVRKIVTHKELYGPAATVYFGLEEFKRICDHSLEDFNFWIMLSDLIPKDNVIEHMRNENLIERSTIFTHTEDDWERWCLVKSEQDGLRFYDKPRVKPPTNHVVTGLYRITSAEDFVDSVENYGFDEDELQFSYIFETMQEEMNHKFHEFSIGMYSDTFMVDFGTLAEYNKNRAIRKERAFNKIERVVGLNNDISIKKSSTKVDDLFREAYFMRENELNMFYPNVREINISQRYYKMDYIEASNLRELAVFLDRSDATWNKVFRSIFQFLEVCRNRTVLNEGASFWKSVNLKNQLRFQEIPLHVEVEDPIDIQVWLDRLSERLIERFPESTMFHGDLHFANMFYDFDKEQLKLVDPKGDFCGHWFYDLAKLTHSIIGRYDFIDAELYVKNDNEHKLFDKGYGAIGDIYLNFLMPFLRQEGDFQLLMELTASLFLTMIPLHSHNTINQELFLEEFYNLRTLYPQKKGERNNEI